MTTSGQKGIVDFVDLLDVQSREAGIYTGNTGNHPVDNIQKDEGYDQGNNSPLSKSVKVAYAAFFGHVGHRILEVSSGYHVSLVYNFTFGDGDVPGAFFPRDSESMVPSSSPYQLPSTSREIAFKKFHSALSSFLKDPSFLPTGGLLGFQLSNHYENLHAWTYTIDSRAIATTESEEDRHYDMNKSYLSRKFSKELRGLDLVLHDVCTDLKLNKHIFYVYQCGETQVASEHKLSLFPDTVFCVPELKDEANPEIELQLAGAPLVERNTANSDGTQSQATAYFTWVRKSQTPDIESPFAVWPEDDKDGWLDKLRLRHLPAFLTLIVFVGPPGKREDYKVYIPVVDERVHERYDAELRDRYRR